MEDADGGADTLHVVINCNIMGHSHMREIYMVMPLVVFRTKGGNQDVGVFFSNRNSLSSLNRICIKNMSEKGDKKAALVMRLSENYDSLLSTIPIGNNIVSIASASLAAMLFVKMLGNDPPQAF